MNTVLAGLGDKIFVAAFWLAFGVKYPPVHYLKDKRDQELPVALKRNRSDVVWSTAVQAALGPHLIEFFGKPRR